MKIKKIKLNFIIIFVVAVFLVLINYLGFLNQQEMFAYDWLMRTRPKQAVSEDIIIVEIADDTLRGLGKWPLTRNYHAALIKALTSFGVSEIVFDILFSEAAQDDNDGAFEKAIKESGRVYLPTAFWIEKNKSNWEAKEVLSPVLEKFKAESKGVGHINVVVDKDGKIRKLPLWIKFNDELVPYLGFAVATKRLEYLPKIDLDEKQEVWINFPGHWVSTFAHYSYLDILKAYADNQNGKLPAIDLNVFKNKICFIGLTATGTTDLRPTPIDESYPLLGVQASVCDSVLRGQFIKRLEWWARAVINILFLVLILMVCQRFAPVSAFFVCCLISVSYVFLVWFIFALCGVFTDLVLPVYTIFFVYAGSLLNKFFVEKQKRKLLEKELEIASTIQKSFLPANIENFKYVQIRTYLKPAKFVAGDFYDIIVLDDSTLGVFIGDVSGKGASAALIMAQAISLLRIVAQKNIDPGFVLTELNKMLFKILKGRFVTGQYLVIHTKEGFFQGACAGHNPMLVFQSQEKNVSEVLKASGPPLGLMDKIVYTTVKNNLVSGQKFFLYTDGWTEARNKNAEEFGIKRLIDIFQKAGSDDIETVKNKMQQAIENFEVKNEQHDDVTSVFLEIAIEDSGLTQGIK